MTTTMKMTNKEYAKYVDEMSPKTKTPTHMLWAFLVGGAICTLGQGFKDMFIYFGLDKESAGTASSVSLIFLAAFFTAVGVYDNFAKHAGAGALVPITGFSNAMVSPAMEFKSEGLITGMAAKMFTISGPVLVFGISASVIYGIVLVILR